jgi:hypothetical protein
MTVSFTKFMRAALQNESNLAIPYLEKFNITFYISQN